MFRCLFIFLLALVGATLGGAVAGPGTAQAQGSDIDLAVSIKVPASVARDHIESGPTITVTNRGSDTAYTVRVVIEADNNVSLDPTSNLAPANTVNIPPIGSVALHDSKLIWSIDRLPGKSVYEYTVLTAQYASASGIQIVQYVATVSSRSALEPEHNNRAEVWQVRKSPAFRALTPNYAVSVAVDDRFPAEQGDVTFTVVASLPGVVDDDSRHLRDARVTIPLPAGLTYKSATAPAGTSYNSSTGIWTIGDWHLIGSPPTTAHSLTLTATRAANTVLHEQCVAAEISAKPPEPIDKVQNNRSEVCLGAPPVLFQRGEVDTFTIFPCVGITSDPCDNTDDIRVRAVDKTATPERILAPDTVLIHVQDAPGRTLDGQMYNNVLQSVNNATTVSWQTATEEIAAFTGTRRGVKIAFSRIPFNNHLSSWTRHSGERVVVRGADDGSPPGSMHIRSSGTGRSLSRMNSANSWTATYNGSTSSFQRTTPSPWFAEFEKLGTYVVDYTTRAIHSDGTKTPDCDFDNDSTNESFCDTETYTFHVGPISELAVQDAGPSPDATSSQRAFTLMAVNNGPDTAPAAQVTVDLQGATVSQATPSQGSYSNGVWTIGALAVNDQTTAPTLTLITDAPVDTPITATITNTQDYEVCIDSSGNDLSHDNETACIAVTGASWYTATYYDYISDNNEATITAQAGTAEASQPTAAITVEWTAQPEAASYQIWRQGSPWTLIAEVSGDETRYTDTTAEPGKAYTYTVRALDALGIPVSSEVLVAAAPQTGGGQGSGGGGSGSGGTTRPEPTDHHGNSPATATPLAPTARVGGFLHSGDQDYFRLILPHAGLLHVETAGWANTVGTVWQSGVELGSAELGGRRYNFKLGVPVQPGPVVIRVTERSRTAFGTYRLYTRFIAGAVDQPRPLTVQNGLGMVTGWICSADPVVLEIDGLPYHPAPLPAPVPPPSPRVVGTGGSGLPPRTVDPHDLCDDTATGFGLPVNWNLLGDGQHTIIASLDDIEFSRTLVQITTLGEEFVHDAHGTCTVEDFPLPDHSVSLVWQEAGQHFTLRDGQPPPVSATPASAVTGMLEVPAPGSFQSGRGSISGWVCDAEAVVIEINGQPALVAYGTERLDTVGVCDDPASGFGLSLDWNQLGPGDHEVVALADGEVFGRATVRVTTLGAAFRRDAETAFLRGLVGECVVEDFPAPGEAVHLEWQEATQNFVITNLE